MADLANISFNYQHIATPTPLTIELDVDSETRTVLDLKTQTKSAHLYGIWRSKDKKYNHIVMDSGATDHFTDSLDNLFEVRDINPVHVRVGQKNAGYTCSKSGSMIVKCELPEGGHHYVRFDNVLYAPHTTGTFISTSKLDQNGYITIIKDRQMTIFTRPNQFVCRAVLHTLYDVLGDIVKPATFDIGRLRRTPQSAILQLRNTEPGPIATPTPTPTPTELVPDSKSQDEPEQPSSSRVPEGLENEIIDRHLPRIDILAHRRLGHVSATTINRTKDQVYGLKAPNQLATARNFGCTTCDLTNVRRYPVRRDVESTRNPHRHHSDAKHFRRSTRGYRMGVIFIHEGSKHVVGFKMKDNLHMTDHLRQYYNMIGRNRRVRFLAFRADGDGAYTSEQLLTFLRDNGIQIDYSTPRRPEENGLAERTLQTIVRMMRSMLRQSGLGNGMWCYAWDTAIYLYNRMVHAGQQQTPHQLFTGQIPIMDMLVTFGCIGVAHVPEENRSKWESDRGKYVRMLGYDIRYRTYIVMDRNGRVYRRKVSRWYETLFTFPNVSKRTRSSRRSSNDDDNAENNDLSTTEDISDDDETEDDVKNVRRSKRERRGVPPARMGYLMKNEVEEQCMQDHHTHVNATDASVFDILNVPSTFKKAITGPEKHHWIPSVKEELRNHIRNKTWTLIKQPRFRNMIKWKWVFKKKTNADGTLRYKSRLVVKGYSQHKGEDYFNTFAPTLSLMSFRTLLALASTHKFKIHNVDIDAAFLTGDTDAEIYTEIPEGYEPISREEKELVDSGEPLAFRLNKSVHGLKQAAAIFHELFRDHLLSMGFTQCRTEPCIFMRVRNDRKVIVGLYVDDLVVLYKVKNDLEDFMKDISKGFKFKNLGSIQQTLGLQVTCNNQGEYTVHQSKYIQMMAEKYNVRPGRKIKTPLSPSLDLDATDSPIVDNSNYRSIIGALLYLAVASRPDISHAVARLSSYSNEPRRIHYDAAIRLIKYLVTTIDYSIRYGGVDTLYAHVDASFGICKKDMKSYTGYLISYGQGTIAWRSVKQRVVANSTAEAEYIALSAVTREIIFLRQLLEELGFRVRHATEIFEDNAACITLSESPGLSQASKSIRIAYHNVRDCVKTKEIRLIKIEGTNNRADLLTKAVSGATCNKYNGQIFIKRNEYKKGVIESKDCKIAL